MEAHAIEGVRLELGVDVWPFSINIAMLTGLVVNEFMTNALKHSFVGRDKSVISLSSSVNDEDYRVIVSDDGSDCPMTPAGLSPTSSER